MNFYHKEKWWTDFITLGCFVVCEKTSEEKDPSCGEENLGLCMTMTLLHIHRCWFVITVPNQKQLCFHTLLILLTSPQRTFSCSPNWNQPWKDEYLNPSTPSRKVRKSNFAQSQRKPTNPLSRTGNTGWNDVSTAEGSTLKVLKLNDLYFLSINIWKKSSVTFWSPLV